MSEYIIVGDSDSYEDCLVCVVHGGIERAREVLARMLTDPTQNDKMLMKGLKNFRIKVQEEDDAWW